MSVYTYFVSYTVKFPGEERIFIDESIDIKFNKEGEEKTYFALREKLTSKVRPGSAFCLLNYKFLEGD